MTKLEVQQRVLQNGKPLHSDRFTWDDIDNVFSSDESYLLFDFVGVNNCTFNTGHNCTFMAGFGCTFKVGSNCVAVRRGVYQVIELEANKQTILYPPDIVGYCVDNICSVTGQKVIVADGILSYIQEQRGNIYHVINHGESNISYLIKHGDIYSHGSTLKEAKESFKYKISNRDTSQYQDWNLETKVSLEEMIKAYRVITGACESGTRYFCENNELPQELTVNQAIDITKGSFNNEVFKEFLDKKG